MDAGDTFPFFHADFGPINIMVVNDGIVIAIINWEAAAFYPRFWINT